MDKKKDKLIANISGKTWGGKRVGAGRKSKKGIKESDIVPGPRKGIPEFVVKDTNVGATGARNVNQLAPTVKEKVKFQRMIREGVEGMFKLGNYIRCPDDLDRDARNEWNFLMACYSAQEGEFLSTLDTSMLRLFCEAKSRYRRAYRKWTIDYKCEVIGENKDEQAILDRLIKVRDTEFTNMQKLAPDLALTPSGRAKAGMLLAKALTKKPDQSTENAMSFLESMGD